MHTFIIYVFPAQSAMEQEQTQELFELWSVTHMETNPDSELISYPGHSKDTVTTSG